MRIYVASLIIGQIMGYQIGYEKPEQIKKDFEEYCTRYGAEWIGSEVLPIVNQNAEHAEILNRILS